MLSSKLTSNDAGKRLDTWPCVAQRARNLRSTCLFRSLQKNQLFPVTRDNNKLKTTIYTKTNTYRPITRPVFVQQVNNQSIIPSTDVIQLTLTLKMTTAQVMTGCGNVSHCQQQQSNSGLHSPGRSNSTYFSAIAQYSS